MLYLSLSHRSTMADKMDPFGPTQMSATGWQEKLLPAAKKRRESVEPRQNVLAL